MWQVPLLSICRTRFFLSIIFDIAAQKYYHAALMSGPAAAHVLEDPIEFARSAGVCSGSVAVTALPRLQDRLLGSDGSFTFTLRGGRDARQRPQLRLKAEGALSLSCGRCLAAVTHLLKVDSTVLLMPPGDTPPGDEDAEAPEWIEAGRDLDVVQLLEDEILLTLPISVRHTDGLCVDDTRAAAGQAAEKRAGKPFAALSALRGSTGRDRTDQD